MYKIICQYLVKNSIKQINCEYLVSRQFSLNNNLKNKYDIVIAGGGLVGTTLACTLGKNSKLANKRILLLEAGKESKYSLNKKYSNRVVSLNPGTFKLLNDINAWSHIEDVRFAPVKRLQVWDALSDASITFGDEENVENVSYIVENDLLLHAVTKEVQGMNNIEIIYGGKVKEYRLPDNNEMVKIVMDNDKEYFCELLLGCDGVNSQVRKAMQVNYLNWSYNQMGVVATLKLSEKIENKIAWQRLLPSGPIALLPLNDEFSSLVWTTCPEHAKDLLSMPQEKFVDAVNNAIYENFTRSKIINTATNAFDTFLRMINCSGDTLRRYPPKIYDIEEGSRAMFPLGFGHSTSYIRQGVVLVGDAAHRVHPLAGQGVNLGFGDVIRLNKVLGNAAYSGSKLDNLSYLKEYETKRQRHNLPTMLAIEGLHRLYSTEISPVVLLRSLGLQATQGLDILKKAITQQAAV